MKNVSNPMVFSLKVRSETISLFEKLINNLKDQYKKKAKELSSAAQELSTKKVSLSDGHYNNNIQIISVNLAKQSKYETEYIFMLKIKISQFKPIEYYDGIDWEKFVSVLSLKDIQSLLDIEKLPEVVDEIKVKMEE